MLNLIGFAFRMRYLQLLHPLDGQIIGHCFLRGGMPGHPIDTRRMGRFIRLLWAFCLSLFIFSSPRPTLDMFYCVYLWWRPRAAYQPNNRTTKKQENKGERNDTMDAGFTLPDNQQDGRQHAATSFNCCPFNRRYGWLNLIKSLAKVVAMTNDFVLNKLSQLLTSGY